MSVAFWPRTDSATGKNMEPGHLFHSALSGEESQSGEGRPRRKLHKSPSESAKAMRKREPTAAKPTDSPEQSTTRMPSIRHYKPPQGARPLVRSPSKNAPTEPALAGPRPTPRAQGSHQHARQSTFGSQGQFNFGVKPTIPPIETGQSSTFSPEVSFDDFHNNITGYAGTRGGAGTNNQDPRQDQSGAAASDNSNQGAQKQSVYSGNGESRISRANSILKQQRESRSRNVSGQSKASGSSTSDQPSAQAPTASSRSRRQSQFPASDAKAAAIRNARKSVGPGFFPPESSDHLYLKNALPGQGAYTRSMVFPSPGNDQACGRGPVDPLNLPGENHLAAGRDMRRKLTQQSRNFSGPLTSSMVPEAPWSAAHASASRSPARESLYGATTPSSGKRLSMMPGHATGLGARTISPTDARRLKRMSMMPAPPLPSTPPILFPEPPSFPSSRSAAGSPSMIPRKSVTPSSNRTTPDHNRKSFNSAISISSSTSMNSLRGMAGGGRGPSNASASRLPTLKPRSETAMATTQEVVPPVPAIPKAYESPKTEHHESPFDAQRMPSVSHDVSSVDTALTADNASAPSISSAEKDPWQMDREARTVSGSAFDRGLQADSQRASGAQDGRRTLQPIRLPPLNLLPANGMSDPNQNPWQESTSQKTPEIHTPPPHKGPQKAPSTPMTASRANFFRGRSDADESATIVFPKVRSNSTHFSNRFDVPMPRPPSTSSSHHGANSHQSRQQPVSPFVSSSVPKTNGTYVSSRTRPADNRSTSTAGVDVKSPRLNGPRSQNTKSSRTETVNGAVTPATDTESTSFGTTLRRKLSLTRKRSVSKAEGEKPSQAQDREAMPPPKLPASATVNGVQAATQAEQGSAQTGQRPTYLHTRRKSSVSENLLRRDRTRSEVFFPASADAKPVTLTTETSVPNLPKAAAASMSSGLRQHSVNSQKATPRLHTIDTSRLDRDDHVAEDEMKRLAARRRNTEIAARELDELRRRAIAKDPTSPSHALRTAKLNLFERGEIVDYRRVYFSGTSSAKKLNGDLGGSDSANFGYDDERGDYNVVLGDHLAYRYEVVDLLGKGSFGQVVRCVDHKTGGLVAIKIIRNKKRFHQQALVEVNILQKLREWDPENKYSMVNFTQSFYFRGHLCISTELLGMNLYEFIKLHEFKGFSIKLIRRFTKQLLNSLVLLKSKKVIHCDLKPENILLAHPAHSEIKVIDFGSSCMEHEKVYTYIQSRFYRSPEVILGMSYGMPIDMWSLGCILAELLTGYPIFPGENEQEQLACIMEVFGPPDKHLIEKSSRRKLFFDSVGKPRLTVSSKGKRRRPSSKTLQQVLRCDDEAFLDFLSRCLRWDPDRRMKPDDATHHEFITGVKAPARGAAAARTIPQAVSTSPIKRFNSVHATPAAAPRPLPDTPATTLKNGVPVRGRDPLALSPTKAGSTNRRHSTMQPSASSTALAGSRKATNGSVAAGTASSTLPRPGGKGSASSRSGLASAAAAAAITKTR